jgi:hypothetical protein
MVPMIVHQQRREEKRREEKRREEKRREEKRREEKRREEKRDIGCRPPRHMRARGDAHFIPARHSVVTR